MIWKLVKNTILLIIYAGVGFSKNMPFVSRVHCIYFKSTNGKYIETATSIKVVPEQCGKFKHKRERFAGNRYYINGKGTR